MIETRPITDDDRAWVHQLHIESWSGLEIARRGELIDLCEVPCLLALLDGERAGVASYAIDREECELVAIKSLREGLGVARALLDGVRQAAIEACCARLWLITTNDNLRALRLYQRWGMDIVGFHRDAVTEARRQLKPSIPELGDHGIRLAHELELELRLSSPRA